MNFIGYVESEFEISFVEESNLLGLQTKQIEEGIHVHQTKHANERINNFGMESAKM